MNQISENKKISIGLRKIVLKKRCFFISLAFIPLSVLIFALLDMSDMIASIIVLIWIISVILSFVLFYSKCPRCYKNYFGPSDLGFFRIYRGNLFCKHCGLSIDGNKT